MSERMSDARRTRLKHLRVLREMADSHKDAAQRELDRPKLDHPQDRFCYGRLMDKCGALEYALSRLGRDHNLLTGELTVSLNEPGEAA